MIKSLNEFKTLNEFKKTIFGPFSQFLWQYIPPPPKKKSGSVTHNGFLAPSQNFEKKTNDPIQRKCPTDRRTEGCVIPYAVLLFSSITNNE